jgi:hypothetical protein
MDADRFDTLTRTLTLARSRRHALGGLLFGSLGHLGSRAEETAAHNPLKKCKKKSGKQKKKCLKKAKAHNAAHAAEIPPPGPTCSDGIKNGSESDVDCGGSCPRCTFDKTCASRDDCTTAFCPEGTCRGCLSFSPCGSDTTGACYCHQVTGVCAKTTAALQRTTCGQCPAGTVCQGTTHPNVVGCHYPCGGINYCPAGADNCLSDTTTCGNGGKCFQPLSGGPTRCGVSAGGCGCTSHQECERHHGSGAFCVTFTPGGACTCGPGGPTTFCATPR